MMKLKEHCQSCFKFWRPSVARRITIYFIVFGMIIFFISSFLYISASKRSFFESTSRLIRTHFSQLKGSDQPDFIWNSIGTPRADLSQLLQTLTNFSSEFYSISDLSLFIKNKDNGKWHRLYFSDNRVLHAVRVEDPSLIKLAHSLHGRFGHPNLKIIKSDNTSSLFVNITGNHDLHQYFLKIELGGEGLSGFIRAQVVRFGLFFIVALISSRLLGYYFARKIAGPIENLSQTATQVAKGDLSHLAPVVSNDEIGKLSESFNTMIEGLREWERIKVVEFELEKGRKIQKDFLPARLPRVPNWDIATFFHPAGKVSGDFYDVFVFPDGCLGVVIADVCDKGVGSALYMALFRSLIRVFSIQAALDEGALREKTDLSQKNRTDDGSCSDDPTNRLKAVMLTNDYIAENHGQECMFATLFFGVLNPSTGTLYYINGGHEPLYVIGESGIKKVLEPTGPAVGMMPDIDFNVRQIQLSHGDVLLGYTDGVTEARSPQDELFSRGRLRSLLEQPIGSASDILQRIKTNLFDFIDAAPRIDDVTMLAVQRAEVSQGN